MMVGQNLLLLTLIGTVIGAPDRHPGGRRIIRSTDNSYSSLPSGQALFIRTTPLDVSSTDRSFLQVWPLTTQEDNAPKTHSVSESLLATGGQALIQPPQLASSPVSTQPESYSAPINPHLQHNSAGSKNQGDFSSVNTIAPSPGMDKTTTTQQESQDATSGDLGRTIAKILHQLTGGAVKSLDGLTLPNSKLNSRGKVHFYTATNPKELAIPPKPKVPIILRPKEQTRTFIAISPLNVRAPFSTFPLSAPHVPHQHQDLPPTYQKRSFQHSPLGQGNIFINNPLTDQESTASFTGSNGKPFDGNGESFNNQNSFVSHPENDGEGFHDTHLNTDGNMQSSFTSPEGADITINTGASNGHKFRAATLTGPFVAASVPVQNVEIFNPAHHTNSATHKSIPAIQKVQTLTPTVQTDLAAQTFTPTLQSSSFIHNPDPAIQNVQTFPPVQTNPTVQELVPTVQNGSFIPQLDPAAQNIQRFPPVQTNAAIQTFAPKVQNGPLIHTSAAAATIQNVQTFHPTIHTGPTAQPFTPAAQSSHTIPQVTNTIQTSHSVQPLASAVQKSPTFQNFASTVQNIPASAPVQTFSKVSKAPEPAGFPPQQFHASVHGSQFGSSLKSVGPTDGTVSNKNPYPSLTFPHEGETGIPQSSTQSHQTFVSESAVSGAVFDNSGGGESGSVSDASGTPQSPSFSASHGFEDGGGLRAVSISDIHTGSESTSLNVAHGSTSTATQFRTNNFASTGNSLLIGTSLKGPGVPLSISTSEKKQ